MAAENDYEKSLRHTLEYAYVVAARRGLDTGQLLVTIDGERQPGIYQEHSLSISVRNTQLSVKSEGFPHEWIEIGTGFIDVRFSHLVTGLLAELEKIWMGK